MLTGCSGEDRELVLPDDPCSIFTRADIADATESEVARPNRVPTIEQVVEMQETGRDAGDVPVEDRPICRYSTSASVGHVSVSVSGTNPASFRTDGLNKRPVESFGLPAYISGGASLQVLIGSRVLGISAQKDAGTRKTEAILVELGRRALVRLR